MTTDHADPQPSAPAPIFGRTGADLSGLAAPAGVHPAATLLPAMRPNELALLRASLAAGWKEDCPPVLVDRRHRVIDGRHRVEILGVPVEQLIAEGKAWEVEWDDDAIVHHVLAANLARRHLTIDEREALFRRLRRLYGKRPEGRPRKGRTVPAGTVFAPTTKQLADMAGISVRQARRLDAETEGRGRRARRGAGPKPAAGKPGATVRAPVAALATAADSAPPPAAGDRGEATDAPWPAFARLDRAGQVAFIRRALRHLGAEPRRIDAALDGVEEHEAEAVVPATEQPGSGPTATPTAPIVALATVPEPRVSAAAADPPPVAVADLRPDGDAVTVYGAVFTPYGRPRIYATKARLPRSQVERTGYRPAGAYTHKGVPGTLLRSGAGTEAYWSPDWDAAPAPAAAA